MAAALKDVYNQAFIESIADNLVKVCADFPKSLFIEAIFDDDWQDKALKVRITHIAQCLKCALPGDYQAQCLLLKQIAPFYESYQALFFSEFVALFGLDEYATSIDALSLFTQHSSAEFAVRPFIERYGEQMMAQMCVWASSDNEHLRRLASEGCRPRLPWASALTQFKTDPSPVLAILTILKDDESLYVRRSVANNLNDISKDHPQIVLDLALSWLGASKTRDWIVKHACRTLLKRGDEQALALFALAKPENVQLDEFTCDEQVVWGGKLQFSFVLNSKKALGELRLEFAIDFMKANGKLSRKVFKISQSDIKSAQKKVSKSFSFKAISTREYYAGEHALAIIVNGVELQCRSFQLLG